ncbi:Signal peptide peptidase-like, aspartyl protease family a22b [Globisporangium polare]
MKLLALLVLAAAALARSTRAATESDDSVDLLRIDLNTQTPPLADSLLFVVARATFGAALPHIGANDGNASVLHIARGDVSDDCTRVTTPANAAADGDATLTMDTKTAVLVDRGGNCSFVQKALAAQHFGASLVIVRDTIMGAFVSANQPGPAASAPYDCLLGKGSVSSNASFPLVDASSLESESKQVAACANAHSCSSGECILTGKQHTRNERFQICCFQSRLVRMSATADQQELASAVRIPAIFLTYQDAETLEQLMKRSSESTATVSTPPVVVQAFNSEESPWNVSMALSWLLGVCVVMGAAYHSCTHERVFSYQKVAHALANSLHRNGTNSNSIGDGYVSIDDRHTSGSLVDGSEPGEEAQRESRLELTGRHALLFLIGASCVLLLVYYVHLLLLISVLFAVGASAAVAQVVFIPLVLTVLPDTWTPGNKVFYISGGLGLMVGTFWFVERSWPPIWPLQDLLCIALCFVFIDTIELPSLRVGAILLSVAFVYDVFFVYLSPFVFGSNVMVDVASGGGNTRRVLGLSFCDQHPQDPACLHHQSVPMVLSIPLLFSFYGGNALLGLGDLIIPGLLVAFCIRYDYCMGYPLSTKYFCVASASYATGLLIANVMAIVLRNVVAGQPALMYIVPLMLTAVMTFAKWNGELQVLWDGPLCLQMLDDEAGDGQDEEHGETQPLVRTSAT